VLLLAALLAGCGSSSSSSSSSSPSASSTTPASGGTGSAAGTIEVTMKNLAFSLTTVHAKVGQTVHWVNDDGPPHNVTGTSGPKFTPSSTLSTGGSFQLKLTQPGTIHYICTIHPFMKATIVVGR